MINRFRKNVAAIAPLLLICLPALGQEARLTPRVNQAHPTLAIGSPAPDFSLPGTDDKIHKLAARCRRIHVHVPRPRSRLKDTVTAPRLIQI